MADRPILFSAPMIRALLEGRKTQTRRIIKPQPEQTPRGMWHIRGGCLLSADATDEEIAQAQLDYIRYEIGDRLWVRESLTKFQTFGAPQPTCHYPADDTGVYGAMIVPSDGSGRAYWQWQRDRIPSIHMPRWASRLTLVVKDVRVQRLQDISKEDVIAEGISEREGYPIINVYAGWHEPFAQLWERINGDGAWDANPFVVALTFDVRHCNIDKLSEDINP